MVDLKIVATKERKNRVKWGFIWALICALLWGIGYVPLTLLWTVPPFIDFPYPLDGSSAYLMSSVMISAFQAIVFGIVVILFWALLTGKLKETVKTVVHVKITKWLLIGAAFGGPCAVMGSTLAIGYIGASFASSIALLSAVVGALAARIVYKEKMSSKTVAGILLLVVGGFIILNPVDMINNIMNPLATDGLWLGYFGGAMSALGFGIEGIFAARALDVTDADSSLPVKYISESLLWLIIIFPICALLIGPGVFWQILVDTAMSGSFIFWMVVGGLTLGMCYVSMYKCYPLIGVGRTLSITAMYVPISLAALIVFFGQIPGWWIMVGAAISVIGMFVMYWESGSVTESTRDTGGA